MLNRDSPNEQKVLITPISLGGGVVWRGGGSGPALTYLARLSPGSRPAQAGALRILVGLLAPGLEYDPTTFPWERVLPEQASLLRARLTRDYAPATAKRILAALRGVLKEAWRLGILDRDRLERVTDIPPVKGSRPKPGRIVTPEEIERLYECAYLDELYNLILLFEGGLRRAELRTATVRRGPGRWEVSVSGKGGKSRKVFIACPWVGRLYDPEHAQGWPSNVVGRRLRALAKRAGTSPFTAHDARRTFASRALASGLDIATVQRVMGHADPRTTASYDRRGDEALLDLAEALTRDGKEGRVGE